MVIAGDVNMGKARYGGGFRVRPPEQPDLIGHRTAPHPRGSDPGCDQIRKGERREIGAFGMHHQPDCIAIRDSERAAFDQPGVHRRIDIFIENGVVDMAVNIIVTPTGCHFMKNSKFFAPKSGDSHKRSSHEEDIVRHDIKGLLFDKDGTLFDFHATWGVWTAAFLRELVDMGADEAALSTALGFDPETRQFAADSAVIAGTPDETIDAIMPFVPDWTRAKLENHILKSTADAPLAEAAPLSPLLDRFVAAGLALGVATNDSEDVAHAHLGAAGVSAKFAFIAGYDSGHGAKPEPGMQLAFAAATGIPPAQIAMVGDSNHDLISGRRAKMKTIGVLTGTADRKTLEPNADVVLENIGQIPDWLGL